MAPIARSSARLPTRNHGDVDASRRIRAPIATSNPKRARNGTYTTRWGSVELPAARSTGTGEPSYNLYSANYANWYFGDDDGSRATPASRSSRKWRRKWSQTLEGVNLGLMRYSVNADGDSEGAASGGMVTYPVSPLNDTTRAEMVTQINSWNPGGYTPLSETFYEAHQYLSGGDVAFGENSRLYPADRAVPSERRRIPNRQRHSVENLQESDGVQLPEDLHRVSHRRFADQ